jgi:AraC-like DNA-binding protein
MDAYTRSASEGWIFRLGIGTAGALEDIPSASGSFKAVLLAEGAAILADGDRRRLVEAPACLCLSDRRSLRAEGEEGCRFAYAAFDPAIINDAFGERDVFEEELFAGDERYDRFYLEPFLDDRPDASGILGLGQAQLLRLEGLFSKAGEQLAGQPDCFWPCRARSFLLESLILIRQVYESPRDEPGVPQAGIPSEGSAPDMEKVALYIHVHFAEKLSIAGLASAFGTNRTTLMARFKRFSGVTINEYVVALRVRMAGLLLRDTGIPVSEIAYRAGFKDLTHFGRTFRRRTGETPTEYRAGRSWLLKSAS